MRLDDFNISSIKTAIKSNLYLGTSLCFVASNQMVTGYTWDSQMRVPGDKIASKSLPTEPLL